MTDAFDSRTSRNGLAVNDQQREGAKQSRLATQRLHDDAYCPPPAPRTTDMTPPPATPVEPKYDVAKEQERERARRAEIALCLKNYSTKELRQVHQLVNVDIAKIDSAVNSEHRKLDVVQSKIDVFNSDMNAFDKVDSQFEKMRVLRLTNLLEKERYVILTDGHMHNNSSIAFELPLAKVSEAVAAKAASEAMSVERARHKVIVDCEKHASSKVIRQATKLATDASELERKSADGTSCTNEKMIKHYQRELRKFDRADSQDERRQVAQLANLYSSSNDLRIRSGHLTDDLHKWYAPRSYYRPDAPEALPQQRPETPGVPTQRL